MDPGTWKKERFVNIIPFIYKYLLDMYDMLSPVAAGRQ